MGESVVDDLETTPEKSGGIKSQHGGKRPGSGQPPNAVKYKAKIAKATDIMGRMLPEAATATVDLATGAYVILAYNATANKWEKPRTLEIAQQVVDFGLFRVYQELPNMKAIEVMFERLMGKVVQPVDITVRQAISQVIDSQSRIMRIIEEHATDETLAAIRADIERVVELHQDARAAVGIE